MQQTLIVFSADQPFFPLAKGLVLSVREHGLDQHGIGLAFIDIGCDESSLGWLRAQRVLVTSIPSELSGELAGAQGYHRSQVCRPLLPRIFPGVGAFIWLDSDLWVQSPDVLPNLHRLAHSNPDKLFICPEWHYSYVRLNHDLAARRIEMMSSLYGSLYDANVAAEMAARPVYNTGVMAMSAGNLLWDQWRLEIARLYARPDVRATAGLRHLAEQAALNVLTARSPALVPLDPLFNYTCCWGLPVRDPHGTVRVALPPGAPLGVIHLAAWQLWRKTYIERGLLYRNGDYLTPTEKQLMTSAD